MHGARAIYINCKVVSKLRRQRASPDDQIVIMAATVLSMSSFPPSKSPENSITEMDPFESPSSPSSSSKPSITEVFQLKDYKDFTYRDMVNKVDLHYDAINENKQLQLALRHVLQSGKLPQDIKSIMEYCKHAGGLLGHRKDILTSAVDAVLSKLNTRSIPQRLKEIQALQLICEALLDLPSDLIQMLVLLNSKQQQRLLQQFQAIPLGTNIHSFANKGAWADPNLRLILDATGFKVVNRHLQLHRDPFKRKDYVRSATMAVLAVKTIFDDNSTV